MNFLQQKKMSYKYKTACPNVFYIIGRSDNNGQDIYRISEEMKKEVSSIIQNELKDPRLPKVISVISANVTKDLRFRQDLYKCTWK